MRTRAHNTTPPTGPLRRWVNLLMVHAGLLGALLSGGCAEDFSAVLELMGQANYGTDMQCQYYTAHCRLGEAFASPSSPEDPCQADYQDEFGDWLSCWDEIDEWFEAGELPKDVREAVGSVPVRHPTTKVEISGDGKTGCSYPSDGEPSPLAFGESACCAGGSVICHCDKTAGLIKSDCVSGRCAADPEGARCQAKEGERCATFSEGKLKVDACEPGTYCASDGCLSIGRCQSAATPGLPETCPAANPSCIQNEGDPNAIWSLMGPLCLPGTTNPLYLTCASCQDGRCHLEDLKIECVDMPPGMSSLIVRDL